MCMGIPMQVIDSGPGHALCCDRDGSHHCVDTQLVGQQPPGTWLLIFLGAAREVLDEVAAQRIGDALEALGRVMQGDTGVDHLFADLADREPQLPEFLRPANSKE